MFLANDPHNGGGLHPQDVMVQRPVFVDDQLIAWVVISAHMMDMGGMVVGSFAPAATECYQEALRLPPVRLFRGGVEEADVWAIFRTNIRLSELVEMDLRSLVAGCHVAEEKIVEVLEAMGADEFVEGIGTHPGPHRGRDAAPDQSARRRRVPGGELGGMGRRLLPHPVPAHGRGRQLVFDFDGASPQANHFFNSKPYIIESEMVAMLAGVLARDLPFNDGIFAPIELRCPEGTIVNAQPPAPIAAAHMDVALNASEVGLECVRLALAASPDAPARRWLTGWGTGSALGLHTWSGTGIDGNPDAFIMLDGNWVGSAAGVDRDGLSLAGGLVGRESGYSFTDIEILESWYPILVKEKRSRPGEFGAGEHRAGGGNMMGFQPHGTDKLTGAMLGMRRWLPLLGGGGGTPGACTEFIVHRGDGGREEVPTHASGVELGPDDVFEFRCASGGGFGDALDRDPVEVRADIERGVFDAEVAGAGVRRDLRRRGSGRRSRDGGTPGRDRPRSTRPRAAGTDAADGHGRPRRAGSVRRRRAALPRRRATGRTGRQSAQWRAARGRAGALDRRVPRARRDPCRPGPRSEHPLLPRSGHRAHALRRSGTGGRAAVVRGRAEDDGRTR